MLEGTLYPPGPGDNVSLTGSRCADVPNANVGARYLFGLPPSQVPGPGTFIFFSPGTLAIIEKAGIDFF